MKSWGACSELCRQKAGCKYWIWCHERAGPWAFQCFTMSDYGYTNHDTNVVSGTRDCKAPCPQGWEYFHHSEKCYKLVNKSMRKMADANAYCKEKTGDKVRSFTFSVKKATSSQTLCRDIWYQLKIRRLATFYTIFSARRLGLELKEIKTTNHSSIGPTIPLLSTPAG